jgi:hypothetical protein
MTEVYDIYRDITIIPDELIEYFLSDNRKNNSVII